MDFETRAIHEGQEPDPATGAVTVPIYQTSTYAQEAVGEHKGYDYSRTANPTRRRSRPASPRWRAPSTASRSRPAWARRRRSCTCLARATGSSPSTTSTAAPTGCSRRSTSRRATSSSSPRTTAIAEAIDERTRLVWLETPTNPLLNIVDIRAVAEAAHAAGRVVVVDNTFATPYLQRPLELGADIVVHSTTKYLGGHSDLVGGFAGTNDPTIAERLAFLQNSLGAVPGPFDSWLVLRGLKTLALRMQRALRERARGRRVPRRPPARSSASSTPASPDHPGHELAARQMADFGGMVSFLASSAEEAVALVARTKIWKLAESLGGVESLIEQPAAMTHASTADAPFASPREPRPPLGRDRVRRRPGRRPRGRARPLRVPRRA